ncbi:hypothetical protein DAEQUDRAFT_721575 [Daedalea quercina L-15889]|uniref:RNA-dependent RNA polymerase n=1 Tax=Daedalea quercina L-15889 TaxID=1314783 RepID=A0A165TJ56_9APHY|nr:hypothetical protein DAEQUDRAFT_721575 [Daedalea quercina L-15889]
MSSGSLSARTVLLNVNSVPLDDQPPPLSRASTLSSHYFDEVEELDPVLLDQISVPDGPVALGKRPFAAISDSPDNSEFPDKVAAVGPERPAKRQRVHAVDRNTKNYHLTPEIIAHIPGTEVAHLPYGVQWELARVWSICTVKATDAPLAEKLSKLSVSSNVQGVPALHACLKIPPVASTTISTREQEVKSPWKELDTEQTVLAKDPYGALGGRLDSREWIGGRVHFTATLQLDKPGNAKVRSAFVLKLEAPTMGSSNRFARRFGSCSILRVRVPDDVKYTADGTKHGADDLIEYFLRPFIIHHHVFRAFYAKDGNVFLFRTKECYRDGTVMMPPEEPSGSGTQFSLDELLSWHNKLENNQGQSMTKWAARFALGLSNSVPGIRVEQECVHEVNDIVCGAFDRRGKVPSQMVMTDGCGLTSRNVLRALTQQLGWSDEPTTVQMRLAGAKGLLLANNMHVPSHSLYHIGLRPSQIKIDLGNQEHPLDPAMLVIDVIKPGRLSTPSRLSDETVINLAENGVPLRAFVALMKHDLDARVDGLTQWAPPASVYSLYRNVGNADGVVTQRLIREAAGTARAKGYTNRDAGGQREDRAEDEDGLDELDELLKEQSTAWWADPTSGCPSTISETVLVLLDSGFLPDKCPVLGSKLKNFVKQVITQCSNKCHIAVPMSCTAFVVPDPCNVLAPNEVHVKSSSRNLIDQDGMLTDMVLGDVLVTRHPCKVPTDVQKVTAVYKSELGNYVDVVVVSTQNHCFNGEPLGRHLASMTGGGDYDGDTLEVFWDPSIVSHFDNADPKFAQEPEEVQAALRKNPETVKRFLRRTSSCSGDIKLAETQKYLLGALRNVSRVGIYSGLWLATAYKNGYSHPDTIFLAYMFTNILDGAKTGVTVGDADFEEHKRKFRSLPLPWTVGRKQQKTRGEYSPDDTITAKRGAGLPPFVLEQLYRELQVQCDALRKRLDTLFPEKKRDTKPALDEHLAAPWRDAEVRAAQVAAARGDGWMQAELDAIRVHVEAVYAEHAQRVKSYSSQSRTGSGAGRKATAAAGSARQGKGGAAISDRPIEQRQDIFRELSKAFDGGPAALPDGSALLCFDKPTVRRLCASYAYIHDREQSFGGWSRFPWDVAMRTLCQIKVEALGGGKALMEDFYNKMAIPKSFVKQR